MSDQKRVFVVEDDPVLMLLYDNFLGREGFAIAKADHGDLASAYIAKTDRPPDIVILDQMLPGKSGLEILLEIKHDPRWQDVPVVMLTSKKHPDDIARAMAAGAARYLTKPFEPQLLLDTIAEILAG